MSRIGVVCGRGRHWSGILVLVAAISATAPVRAQTGLPETGLAYEIKVKVNLKDRTFTGQERITWRNPGKTAIEAVPLHLYLNAFANGASTWMSEQRRGRSLRFSDEVLPPDSWGFNEPTTVRQIVRRQASGNEAAAGTTDADEEGEATVAVDRPAAEATESLDTSWQAVQPDDGNVQDRSLILVRLAEPLAPGDELVLDIAFEGRLPKPVARTGCVTDMCFFAQWFPKLGAFETEGTRGAKSDGFAARQFHSGTEFYANFADFRVTIDAPKGFTVGATGREAGRKANGDRELVTYEQRAVHDFAFVVGKMDEFTSTFEPPAGGPDVAVRYLAYAGRGLDPERAKLGVHGALKVLNRRVGPYPYETLTVVYPPVSGIAIGGMEYPTLFTGVTVDPALFKGPLARLRLFETVDIHEFGHQYFQHLLATNEQLEAYMDEGFNSYWENEILVDLFGKDASNGYLLGRPVDALISEQAGSVYGKLREAIAKQPSALFYPGTGSTQIYQRPAVTLRTAAGLFGQKKVDAVFQAYFKRWKFRHPATEDFLAVVREVGGSDMEAFLREGFFKPRHPDFAIDHAVSTRFEVPLGRYVTGDGKATVVTGANRKKQGALVLGDRARETGARVWAQITDPGWSDETASHEGRVSWHRFDPEAGNVKTAKMDADFYETTVRITGPAWKHLPVDVLFRFEDGVTVRERWDGRAAWRSYRFLRASKLKSVIIDPDHRIALDHDLKNNSRLMNADKGIVNDWTLWTGAFFQTMLNVMWGVM